MNGTIFEIVSESFKDLALDLNATLPRLLEIKSGDTTPIEPTVTLISPDTLLPVEVPITYRPSLFKNLVNGDFLIWNNDQWINAVPNGSETTKGIVKTTSGSPIKLSAEAELSLTIGSGLTNSSGTLDTSEIIPRLTGGLLNRSVLPQATSTELGAVKIGSGLSVNSGTVSVNVNDGIADSIISKIYPINSIYITLDNQNPGTTLGVGTWQLVATGRTLIGSGTGFTANTEIGSNTTTLSQSNIPRMTIPAQSITSSSSGNHTHNLVGSANDSSTPTVDATSVIAQSNDSTTNTSYELNESNDSSATLGTTSEGGSHTHTISIPAMNVGTQSPTSIDTTPLALVVNIWKRTA